MYELSVECCMYVSKNSSVVNVSDVLKNQFEKFVEIFGEGNGFDVEYEWYRRNVLKIKESVQRLGRLSAATKKNVAECFSKKKWVSLEAKQRHSLFDCGECLKVYKVFMCMFMVGVKDLKMIKRAKEAGLCKEKSTSLVRKEAEGKLAELNKEYQDRFDCSFEEAALGVQKFNQKKEKKQLLQKVKENIESQWKETSVLRLAIYILCNYCMLYCR